MSETTETIEEVKKRLGKDFVTHNDFQIPFESSSLVGYCNADYDYLEEILGEPMGGDGYKTDAEWEIHDGETTINLYNWKNGKGYHGEDGQDVEDIREWNIGGMNAAAVTALKRILPKAKITRARF